MNKRVQTGITSKWAALAGPAWLAALLLVLGVAVLGNRASAFSFVQFTDPHLFESHSKGRKGQDLENRAAFETCIARVNQMQKTNREPFEFVVVTGDFGVEQLGSGSPQPTMADGADMAAAMIAKSDIKLWLIVPGNNDLTNQEDPKTIDRYHKFVELVSSNLANSTSGVTVSNLCPPFDLTNKHKSKSAEYTNAHLPNYHFIGFDDACFKSDYEGTNATNYHVDQLDRISQLATTLKQVPEKDYAVIFYHIPEIDDPDPVFNFSTGKLSGRREQKLIAGDPFLYSAWTVSNDVRLEWDKIVKQDKVKWLIAGHFHSDRREIYSDLKPWTVVDNAGKSKYLSVERGKLYVAPPIAVKFQDQSMVQARGFRTYTIDPATTNISSDIYWYEGFTKDGEASANPATSKDGNCQKKNEDCERKCCRCERDYGRDRGCCWWQFLVGILVGILIGLLIGLLCKSRTFQRPTDKSDVQSAPIQSPPPSGRKT